MINICILTSSIELSETIIQYFNKIYLNINVSCIISNNLESNIINKFRRYKIKTYFTNKYKEIDKILTESNIHYIILADYNDNTPKNFTNKYKWRLINHKETDTELLIYYVNINFSKNDIIFKIKKDNSNIKIFYPIIIEKIITETFYKLFN